MNDSILLSIKKMIGIAEDYTHFDADIIIHINSTFAILAQLGVGPESGFYITDQTAKWSDFLTDDSHHLLDNVKTYMFMKVKTMFDPPMSSSVAEAYNRLISEMEWRLNVAAETEVDALKDQ